MPLDMSALINDPMFTQPIQIIRVHTSVGDDGAGATVEDSPVNAAGVVQPAKWDQLQLLPEGERHDETIAVYSTTELTMGDLQTVGADLIVYRGGYYRVAYSKARPENGFWMALAVRFHRA